MKNKIDYLKRELTRVAVDIALLAEPLDPEHTRELIKRCLDEIVKITTTKEELQFTTVKEGFQEVQRIVTISDFPHPVVYDVLTLVCKAYLLCAIGIHMKVQEPYFKRKSDVFNYFRD